jgi:peptidoglycan/xylan/chitin deacetylase (PgdA/CDA1 family)
MKGCIMVLGYHEFAPAGSRDIYCMTPEMFRAHLELIQTEDGVAKGRITFDDAHVSQIRYALPILEETATTAIFFAPTAWVGTCSRTASWTDLRELLRLGHEVGSHSHSHALLTRCSSAALNRELTTSKAMLEDGLGRVIDSISMPGGRYNERVLRACADAGYRRIYTSRPQWDVSLSSSRQSGAMVLGRLIVRRTLSARTIAGYAEGDRSTVRRLLLGYRLRYAAKMVAGDAFYQAVWRTTLRRMQGRTGPSGRTTMEREA